MSSGLKLDRADTAYAEKAHELWELKPQELSRTATRQIRKLLDELTT